MHPFSRYTMITSARGNSNATSGIGKDQLPRLATGVPMVFEREFVVLKLS
jgi:hypothetical protein